MQTTELLEFIRTETGKGVSREAIAASLLKEGWTLEDVEGALHAAAAAPSPLTQAPVAPIQPGGNVIWGKRIPNMNRGAGVVCILLVFTLDLYIANNDRSLMEFWYLMLVVLGAFAVFYVLENLILAKLLRDAPPSAVDNWLMGVVVYRDFLFFINTIPYVQLVGLVALMFTGPVALSIYLIAISLRLMRRRKRAL